MVRKFYQSTCLSVFSTTDSHLFSCLCFRFIDCRSFLLDRKLESDDANCFWISDLQRGFYGNDFGASLLVNTSFSAETLITRASRQLSREARKEV